MLALNDRDPEARELERDTEILTAYMTATLSLIHKADASARVRPFPPRILAPRNHFLPPLFLNQA